MSHCSVESFLPPSSQEEEIYAQMAQWNYQEIPRESVPLSEKLGEGQFGEVYKADFKAVEGTSLGVAVKLVKKGSPPEERTKLLQEAATLGQFKHRHVVRLIGVVTLDEPVSSQNIYSSHNRVCEESAYFTIYCSSACYMNLHTMKTYSFSNICNCHC